MLKALTLSLIGRLHRGEKGGLEALVIAVVVAILIAALLLPVAFDQWFAVTYAGYGAGIIALWPVLPLLAVVGIVIWLIRKATSGGEV